MGCAPARGHTAVLSCASTRILRPNTGVASWFRGSEPPHAVFRAQGFSASRCAGQSRTAMLTMIAGAVLLVPDGSEVVSHRTPFNVRRVSAHHDVSGRVGQPC